MKYQSEHQALWPEVNAMKLNHSLQQLQIYFSVHNIREAEYSICFTKANGPWPNLVGMLQRHLDWRVIHKWIKWDNVQISHWVSLLHLGYEENQRIQGSNAGQKRG